MTDARRRIDVAEADALIRARLTGWGTVRVPLDAAQGEILRQTITAERDQPPFDRVTMDGIAIRHGAFAAGLRTFRVAGTQGAGSAPVPLPDEQSCVAIMTGAALPAGADTVVPVERIARDGDHGHHRGRLRARRRPVRPPAGLRPPAGRDAAVARHAAGRAGDGDPHGRRRGHRGGRAPPGHHRRLHRRRAGGRGAAARARRRSARPTTGPSRRRWPAGASSTATGCTCPTTGPCWRPRSASCWRSRTC